MWNKNVIAMLSDHDGQILEIETIEVSGPTFYSETRINVPEDNKKLFRKLSEGEIGKAVLSSSRH